MRLKSTRAAIGLLAGTALFAGALVGAPANGTTYDSIVSENPSNDTPNVEQGAVKSIAQVRTSVDDAIMVAGGTFTTVTEPGGGPSINRTNLFAFDAETGEISTTFVPQVNGVVNRVVSAGDGQSVFVAGKFTQLGGQNVTKVLRLNATTGARVPGFTPPAINGQVFDMVLADDVLYIAGAFKKVGTVAKSGLAALNPTTGADTQRITASFTDPFNGGTVAAKALDVSADGRYLVVIGNFRTVNGQSRVQIAMFNTDVSPATLATWSTVKYSTPCAGAFNSYMRDVSIAPDGSYFSVVATGAFAGGAGSGTLCDAATRWEFMPTSANQLPTWVNYTGGDTLYSVAATGDSIYLGGHQRWLNNPFSADRAGQGAVSRSGIAVLDARNGLPFSWNPGRQRGVGLREFLPLPEGVWVAHDTDRLGGELRSRIAFMPLAGGKLIPADNTGSLPGDTYSLGLLSGADNVARRHLTTTGVTARETVGDNGVDWSSSRGAFMVDGRLFTGWSNGTLDGAHLQRHDVRCCHHAGPARPHQLRRRAAQHHRHVLRPCDRTPVLHDGRPVPALLPLLPARERHRRRRPLRRAGATCRASTGRAPVACSWRTVSLYIADRVDGNLRSVPWSAGAPVGSPTFVSGPAAPAPNNVNWGVLRSLFLYAP